MSFVPNQAQLEGWVSVDRLSKYAAAPEDTVALYLWNAELTGAFFELIGHVEVLLRNVVHAQLAPHSGNGAWYDDPYYRFNPSPSGRSPRPRGAPVAVAAQRPRGGSWRN